MCNLSTEHPTAYNFQHCLIILDEIDRFVFVGYRYLVLRLIAQGLSKKKQRLIAHQQKLSVSSYPRLCCVRSQFLLGRKDHASCNFLIFQFMQKTHIGYQYVLVVSFYA